MAGLADAVPAPWAQIHMHFGVVQVCMGSDRTVCRLLVQIVKTAAAGGSC